MSLTMLREVFAARNDLSKKATRGAGMVFRGVSTVLRSYEVMDRE